MEINEKYINDNLEIIPNQEYKTEKVSSTIYNIVPLTKLEYDSLYQIKLNDDGTTYSWAFQTKKKFEVTSTIPYDDSEYVDIETGIEMYFSFSNLNNIENFFTIDPKVEGKFIQNDNGIIFSHDGLEKNTKYKVTIKRGFGTSDGSQVLTEDYVFNFRTKDDGSEIYFPSILSNIYKDNKMVVESYIKDEYIDKDFTIDIYKYNFSDDFANDLKLFDKQSIDSIKNKENLIKVSQVKQKPYLMQDTYDPKSLFELPNELEKGYYLLEFSEENLSQNYYTFLQVNEILAYTAFFDNEIFILAVDGKTSNGISSAEITIDDKKIGTTDENGVLIYKTNEEEYKDTFLIKIKADGYNDFLFVDNTYYRQYVDEYYNNFFKYVKFIYTDRMVYLPNDKINLWGFARPIDNKLINKVKIELVDSSKDVVVQTKFADLTNIGTYKEFFELTNEPSGYYEIKVYDNDVLMGVRQIQINEYVKPIYTIDLNLDKNNIKSGEELSYKIKGEFFDGQPANDMEIKLKTHMFSPSDTTHYKDEELVVKLDENGEFTGELKMDVYSESWHPVNIRISCENNLAEDQNVYTQKDINVFPKDIMIEISNENKNKDSSMVDIIMSKIDTSKFVLLEEDMYIDDYKMLREESFGGRINVQIIERYYEKTKDSEYYDFIEKKNKILYKYVFTEKNIYNEDVDVKDGLKSLEIPNYDINKSYEFILTYVDETGMIKESKNIYSIGFAKGEYFYINKIDNKKSYRINDIASFELFYDGEKIEEKEESKILMLISGKNTIDYKLFDENKLDIPFKDSYIPNVGVTCVYIDDGYIYSVINNYYNLKYDTTERQINFDINTDKEEYRPGEEVILNISAKDENQNPCIADIAISVVDEAYFALYNDSVDLLQNIYSTSYDVFPKHSYISNINFRNLKNPGAEMGGGGGYEYETTTRKEFKDTNVFETLKTDKDGKVSMKFKLADNLTSWRITCLGITKELYAGVNKKNIQVSLPFYVDSIMSKKYLKDDKISVSLRIFGSDVKNGDEVEYMLTVTNKETKEEKSFSQKGYVGKYTNISLEGLLVGEYEVYILAQSGDKKDAIIKEISVVDSLVYFNNTNYYKLSNNIKLDEVYSNANIILFNESRSVFFNSLRDISLNNGIRIDQYILSMMINQYINENFDEKLYYNKDLLETSIKNHIFKSGGISLVPYWPEDSETTSRILYAMKDDENILERSKIYLKNLYEKNKEFMEKSDSFNMTEITSSLWGLSKYKEPILIDIYNLLEKAELTDKEKIYLSLSLCELGDMEKAFTIYKVLTETNLKIEEDYVYFKDIKDTKENYETNALLCVLAGKLKDFETGDKLFKYIYTNPSIYTISNFEQFIYIKDRNIMNMNEIKNLFGEVTVEIDGVKTVHKIKLFEEKVIPILKEKIQNVNFLNIKGDIACNVEALGNKDSLDKNKTDDISLKLSYRKDNFMDESIIYNHSDIVEVNIDSYINNAEKSGGYEITYVIPAGFRYVGVKDTKTIEPEIDGQKLTFKFYYNKEYPNILPITFFIQAAQIGKYTTDYTVIKEIGENKLNYVDKIVLEVK